MYALTGSRYGFAYNDPVNGSDPSGLSWYNPCVGTTCASGVAKKAVNKTISTATGGTANCIRGATCARSTKSAYISDQQAADFAGGVPNSLSLGNGKAIVNGVGGHVNWGSGWNVGGSVVGEAPVLVFGNENPAEMLYYSGALSLPRVYGQCTGAPQPGAIDCAAHGFVAAGGAGIGYGLGSGIDPGAGGLWGGSSWFLGKNLNGWIDQQCS